ncbi:MAG: ABC transporter ATP-binding protein [Bacteroidales bacterium]|nr:ABC transporter ATP-binding protein [Bacteroidales bacterium]
MLLLNKITKSFLQRGTVLKDLSLEVREGDMISVSGPSGSGKTTLLNIIGLLDRPDSGDLIFKGVSLLGFDSNRSATYRNRNIGFVFQDHLLLPYLTVKENILLPLLASDMKEDELGRKEGDAEELMRKTNIADLSGKYPFQISGGEAQRVALVRALINKPALLLADEPTGSLDRRNAENLGDLLVQLNRDYGITIILATHSISLARKMKVNYTLSEGKLAEGLLV